MSADASDQKPAAPPTTPEAQALARVTEMKTQVLNLDREVHTLVGRVANRSNMNLIDLETESQQLKQRISVLEKSIFEIINASFQPQTPEELRLAAIEYFKESNTSPELWKNLAY